MSLDKEVIDIVVEQLGVDEKDELQWVTLLSSARAALNLNASS